MVDRARVTIRPEGWDDEIVIEEPTLGDALAMFNGMRRDDKDYGFAVVAACAVRSNGERYTVEELRELPARYARGFGQLVRAAMAAFGYDEDAEKN